MTQRPQYDFAGQTAIVTGGARGIGRAVAEHFLRTGAQVWIWDIDPVELNGAHSLISVVAVYPDQCPILLADAALKLLENGMCCLRIGPQCRNPTAKFLTCTVVYRTL
jgi:NAD(P)-dependent dehydrogenase (short-subunit alcohol dehydrogenase family)